MGDVIRGPWRGGAAAKKLDIDEPMHGDDGGDGDDPYDTFEVYINKSAVVLLQQAADSGLYGDGSLEDAIELLCCDALKRLS